MRPSRNQQRKPRNVKADLILLGVVILSTVVLIGILIPARGNGKPRDITMRMTNLRGLVQSMAMYAGDHDNAVLPTEMWPDDFAAWLGTTADDPYFIGEQGRRSIPYIYVGRLAPTFDEIAEQYDASTTPMLYEHPSLTKKHTNVAFWDCSVRAVPDADFEALFDGITNPDGTPYIPVGLDAIEPD